MRSTAVLKYIHDFLHDPEWVAAVALTIQAVILIVQSLILRRHAETMEKHTEIAGTQAEIAKLIGQALDQQGKILTEQNKIMGEQFKFQRRVDARVERGNLFNLVVEARAELEALVLKLSKLQQSNLTQEDSLELTGRFDTIVRSGTACHKAVIMAIHLSATEKKYFSTFCDDIGALNQTDNRAEDFHNAAVLRDKYKDLPFSLMLGQLGQAASE